jgi:hypothetical protein
MAGNWNPSTAMSSSNFQIQVGIIKHSETQGRHIFEIKEQEVNAIDNRQQFQIRKLSGVYSTIITSLEPLT